MNATRIKVGAPLPRIAEVRPLDGFQIYVRWVGEVEGKTSAVVDLAPTIFTFKFYRPLREDRPLFETIRVIDNGSALAWGDDEDFDMAATTVARLAGETMEPADFAAFLKRHGFTFDRAAAELGISRRLVAYYASERAVPRYIALACAYLDQKEHKEQREKAVQDYSRAMASVLRKLLAEDRESKENYSFTKVSDFSEITNGRISRESVLQNVYAMDEYRKASRH